MEIKLTQPSDILLSINPSLTLINPSLTRTLISRFCAYTTKELSPKNQLQISEVSTDDFDVNEEYSQIDDNDILDISFPLRHMTEFVNTKEVITPLFVVEIEIEECSSVKTHLINLCFATSLNPEELWHQESKLFVSQQDKARFNEGTIVTVRAFAGDVICEFEHKVIVVEETLELFTPWNRLTTSTGETSDNIRYADAMTDFFTFSLDTRKKSPKNRVFNQAV